MLFVVTVKYPDEARWQAAVGEIGGDEVSRSEGC